MNHDTRWLGDNSRETEEIIELTLDLEPPEELGLAVQELVEKVVRLQLGGQTW